MLSATKKRLERSAVKVFDTEQARIVFYNAEIAIVGGGPIEDQRRVDLADFVVRTNNHIEHQHGRCDVIFSAAQEEPRIGGHDPILFLPFKGPKLESWLELAHKDDLFVARWLHTRHVKRNPYGPEYEFWNVFNRELQTMPFTGIAAIAFFLSLPIQTLYVTGMSLYIDHGHALVTRDDGSQFIKRDSHIINYQAQWLYQRSVLDHRLELDPNLHDLLKAFLQVDK